MVEQLQCLHDSCLWQEGYTRILQYGIDFLDWGCEILLSDPDGDGVKSSPRTLHDLPDHPQDLCPICAIRQRLHD